MRTLTGSCDCLPHLLRALVAGFLYLVPACSVGLDRDDTMAVTESDSGYSILLNDQPVATFSLPELLGLGTPVVEINDAADIWQHVHMRWEVSHDTAQDELAIQFELSVAPDFWWSPHLTPEDGYVVGQHVFRSPALIVQEGAVTLAIVPDLDVVGQQPGNPWFLDYDATNGRMWLGMVETEIPEHVLFRKKPGMQIAAGTVELSFYVTAYYDRGEVRNPWSKVARFLWSNWAKPLYDAGEPTPPRLEDYARHTYAWAFDGWGEFVWQEFDLEGVRVGAPQFIVNISQSPNYPGEWYQREFLSIWNQAWFSSLRSASGLYRYARSLGDEELLRKARLTKELALAAPMDDGLFPSVIRTDNETLVVNGSEVQRPLGWERAYWTSSNRSPRDHGITTDWYHILDASWTALLMLRWHEELEQDERLLDYASTYADRLISLQDSDGFFPGWLHPETQQPGPVMNQTPETSMSVSFLLKLAEITGNGDYYDAALHAMDAVLEEIVPEGRWEDFETYWSCCRWGRDRYLGKKIERNAMFKQNTFSMFWTAEALLYSYRATGDFQYLLWGQRTLDELSMAQQVWQPPFIYVPALGGFGVMNSDGEWNDSRETLFAELFLEYFRETGIQDYFERGISALKSGFFMMYCPENATVKEMWEKVYPWFGPEDYGFTMENYGHGGRTSPEGEGMGVFTIYDWGNGAAAEATMRILDHYGDAYIDRERGIGFGIDGVTVSRSGQSWQLLNNSEDSRLLRVVFEDGSFDEQSVDASATLQLPARR